MSQPGHGAADELVDEIVTRSFERANEPEAADLTRKKSWLSLPLVLGGFVLVVALTVWNVIRYAAVPEGLTPREADTYVQIFTAATAIEAFADSAGRLPASLSQLPIDQSGLAYVANGDMYTLSAVVDGQSVSHRRGVPLVPPEVGFKGLKNEGS